MDSRGFNTAERKIWKRLAIANFIGDNQLHGGYQVVFENYISHSVLLFDVMLPSGPRQSPIRQAAHH